MVLMLLWPASYSSSAIAADAAADAAAQMPSMHAGNSRQTEKETTRANAQKWLRRRGIAVIVCRHIVLLTAISVRGFLTKLIKTLHLHGITLTTFFILILKLLFGCLLLISVLLYVHVVCDLYGRVLVA